MPQIIKAIAALHGGDNQCNRGVPWFLSPSWHSGLHGFGAHALQSEGLKGFILQYVIRLFSTCERKTQAPSWWRSIKLSVPPQRWSVYLSKNSSRLIVRPSAICCSSPLVKRAWYLLQQTSQRKQGKEVTFRLATFPLIVTVSNSLSLIIFPSTKAICWTIRPITWLVAGVFQLVLAVLEFFLRSWIIRLFGACRWLGWCRFLRFFVVLSAFASHILPPD